MLRIAELECLNLDTRWRDEVIRRLVDCNLETSIDCARNSMHDKLLYIYIELEGICITIGVIDSNYIDSVISAPR